MKTSLETNKNAYPLTLSALLMRVLLFSTATTLVACSADNNAPNAELNAALAAPYDYYITNMQSYRYSPSGNLQYQLNATRFTHFPDDEHAELTAPTLVWLKPDHSPWNLRADVGKFQKQANDDKITLTGKVAITTGPTASQPLLQPINVTTEKLLVLPITKQASSDILVTVTTATTSIHGVGMQLDLLSSHLSLLSKVRGIHAP